MHPFLQAQLATLHNEDLKAAASRARAGRASRTAPAGGRESAAPAALEVVIRRTTASDGAALAALATLDSAPLPLGPSLVAEVSGAPRAVLPLDGGRSFGDPFVATAGLVALLELRAQQIHREERPMRRHRRLAWASHTPLRRFV
jgi:hypothetical protein